MQLRPRPAILLGAIVLLLGIYLSPRTDQTPALPRALKATDSPKTETSPRETHARPFSTTAGDEAPSTAAADLAAGPLPRKADRIDASLPPEEIAGQVLSEFGHLPLTAAQFARLAAVQQAWGDMRRELAAAMARREKRDEADVADLQMIDLARDSALRRILGEETFRVWIASRDVKHRAFQSDPQSIGLDGKEIAQIYAAIREHDIATTMLPYDTQNHDFLGNHVDRPARSQAGAMLVAQTKVTLGSVLGRESFERMQRQGLFGLPDLNLTHNDSHLPAQSRPTPANFPRSQNP